MKINTGKKDIILVALVFLVCFSAVFCLLKKENVSEEPSGINNVPLNEEKEPYSKEFQIISGEEVFPRFINSVFFKPYAVLVGDTQEFYIWVTDPAGVEKVQAEIETDVGTTFVDMEISEGDENTGRWQGSWHVCNLIHEEYYQIVFRAFSKNGEENVFTTFLKNKEVL
jgi:hypothetical protein